MDTPDLVREAEIHHLNLDHVYAKEAEAYCERVNSEMHSLETFQMFLHDIDPDAPEVQAFHGCLDDKDDNIKAFAYDIFMTMYEDYVSAMVEL